MDKAKVEDQSEWWESPDPEIDYNEFNKNNLANRYNAAVNTNISNEADKLIDTYEKYNKELNDPNAQYIKLTQSVSTCHSDENPFSKLERIKAEIDLIEQDLEYYKGNPETFSNEHEYTVENSFSELKKLKVVVDYIKSYNNYQVLQKVYSKYGPRLMDKAKNQNLLGLLNKDMLERNTVKLMQNIKVISEANSKTAQDSDNICYEIFLTPDTAKVKMFTQLYEIQKDVDLLQEILGSYDIVSQSIINS